MTIATPDALGQTGTAPSEPRSVDVIIPFHNQVHWLALCLEELYRHSYEQHLRVIVVNDASAPDQVHRLDEVLSAFPDVTLVHNSGDEHGFASACNLGATLGSAECILFLNTDCIVTPDSIEMLSEACQDPNIVLSCPVSNNSADLTYPMAPGCSYLDMARFCRDAFKATPRLAIQEACTVVGNCLMVKRDFFEAEGGFGQEWGLGYGEETDLHMRALRAGKKGVVHLGCYVFHHGGATFQHVPGIEALKKRNYLAFMEVWGREYNQLRRRCTNPSPVQRLHRDVASLLPTASNPIELDVLFYLPGIDQGIGGIQQVVAICNDLIRAGVRAGCALVGMSADRGLPSFREPVLFSFLRFLSADEFLADATVAPKLVVSTIHTSAKVVVDYASARQATAAQFVQGYEGYFENGRRYADAVASYSATHDVITTSPWLAKMVQRHLDPHQHLMVLPLSLNRNVFFPPPPGAPRPFDVACVLRAAPDKGQWLLSEIVDQLAARGELQLLVFLASTFSDFETRHQGNRNVTVIRLPVDQYTFANSLRATRVFIDASLHEGFGLMPDEARLCGCQVVVSDSGGVRRLQGSGIVIEPLRADPDAFVSAIDALLRQDRLPDVASSSSPYISAWVEYVELRSGRAESQASAAPTVPRAKRPWGKYRRLAHQFRFALAYRGRRALHRVRPLLPDRIVMAVKILMKGMP